MGDTRGGASQWQPIPALTGVVGEGVKVQSWGHTDALPAAQNLLEIQTYISILQQIVQTAPQVPAVTRGMREVSTGALGGPFLTPWALLTLGRAGYEARVASRLESVTLPFPRLRLLASPHSLRRVPSETRSAPLCVLRRKLLGCVLRQLGVCCCNTLPQLASEEEGRVTPAHGSGGQGQGPRPGVASSSHTRPAGPQARTGLPVLHLSFLPLLLCVSRFCWVHCESHCGLNLRL